MIKDVIKRHKVNYTTECLRWLQAKDAEKMGERAEKKKSPKPVRKLAEPERVKHTSSKQLAKKTTQEGLQQSFKLYFPFPPV